MGERRGNIETLVSVSIGAPTEERGLRKQSPWSKSPWKPGEIPGSPLMRISRPHNYSPTGYEYSKDMPVECAPIKERGMGMQRLARGAGGSSPIDHTGYDKLAAKSKRSDY